MFKNVGIYVRQKSNHGVDLSAMDSMISFLANQNINLKTDKSSDSVSYTHLTLPTTVDV